MTQQKSTQAPLIIRPRLGYSLENKRALAKHLNIAAPALYTALHQDRIVFTDTEIQYDPNIPRERVTHCQQCKQALTRNQQQHYARYCSRRCHFAWKHAHSALALSQTYEVSYSRLLRARREGRTRQTDDELKIFSARRCAHCERATNIRSNNRLCDVCLDSGLRWCCGASVVNRLPHTTPVADYLIARRSCRVCKRESDCYYARAEQPPAGYVRLSAVVHRIGYDIHTVSKRIRQGWMAGFVWQRTPGSPWYIEDRQTYPMWGE